MFVVIVLLVEYTKNIFNYIFVGMDKPIQLMDF